MFDDTPDTPDTSTSTDGAWMDLAPHVVQLPAPGGGGLDGLGPIDAPQLPSPQCPALDERHFRGHLEEVRRDETVPKGLQPARTAAGTLLFAAALPLLLVAFCSLSLLFIWTRTGIGILMGIGQRLVDLLRPRDEPKRGRDGGVALRLRIGDAHRTVKARGYLLGPVEEGDELEVWTTERHRQLFLRRARNLTQGGRPVEPPREPWPLALAAMLAWSGLVAAWVGSLL